MKLVRVTPSAENRKEFAKWAVRNRVRTVTSNSFGVPVALFTEIDEALLVGAIVDGQPWVSPDAPADLDADGSGDAGEDPNAADAIKVYDDAIAAGMSPEEAHALAWPVAAEDPGPGDGAPADDPPPAEGEPGDGEDDPAGPQVDEAPSLEATDGVDAPADDLVASDSPLYVDPPAGDDLVGADYGTSDAPGDPDAPATTDSPAEAAPDGEAPAPDPDPGVPAPF